MTPSQRSKAMSHIKGKDTSIEIILRKALWRRGIRYRKNYKALPGTPDIAITKYKIAVFCDSEFFHGYHWDIKKGKLGNNREYWIRKIERNIARDNQNDLKLIALGWLPVHFWGQDIIKRTSDCVEAIEDLIFEQKVYQEDGPAGCL
ncbi:very short patch repair endonuclease [Intestinibacillus massiliensis]|uniref:very short patch repair endonuclease n=1 Tax=Intestinibacillus massiliensis TaxID=1871029 RepID=UPI000B352BD1|nr:very short patch repair endonuclease [Intestinibacillus massiliensis]